MFGTVNAVSSSGVVVVHLIASSPSSFPLSVRGKKE